jgi:hypothetical protein
MITYLNGDATNPDRNSPKAIIHINNDIGAWGSGFVLAISKRWKKPEARYREWHKVNKPVQSSIIGSMVNTTGKFQLGEIQLVQVEQDLFVINMIAQKGVYSDDIGDPPIRYGALDSCLEKVRAMIDLYGLEVVGPRFGAGLAGGSWDKIEPLIEKNLDKITIYDWP